MTYIYGRLGRSLLSKYHCDRIENLDETSRKVATAQKKEWRKWKSLRENLKIHKYDFLIGRCCLTRIVTST